ncbi:MAG: hypothetical protein HY290_17120 [Planctomycetia bacterium]|nr:hypothetical protein [Planctomycetia bacterium]
MTCADFETLLDVQFAPAALREHPALAEHAAACPDCRIRWEKFRLLADAVVAWREQVPEVDLTTAVLAGLPSAAAAGTARGSRHAAATHLAEAAAVENPRPTVSAPALRAKSGLDRSRRALVVAAAALAAVVSIAVLTPAFRQASHQANSIVLVPATGAPVQHDGVRQPHRLMARSDAVRTGVPSSYSGLAELAVGAWDEVSMLVRPEAVDPHSPRPAPGSRSTDGWIDGLQDQLKPIGRGLDNAFDFLWQAGQSGDG